MPSTACIIYTTTSKISEARRLSSLLVKNKLAACVQISSAVESHYIWENKACKAKEYVLAVKTRLSLYSAVEKLIRMHHSYKVPQILAVPVLKIDRDYEKWLNQQVKA